MDNSIKTLIRSLSFSIIFLLLYSTSASANIYSYISTDGSSILTDKRIKKEGYTLIKVYKIKKKKSPLFIKTRTSKKTTRNNGIVHSCADKQHLTSKARAYQRTIQVYSRIYGVEEELIHAIVKQESCFNEKAHSRSGAIGLMQLMPGTADMMKISNPWDPEQNIQAGVKYISKMLNLFKGKKRFALAAYNAGPGNVKKYRGIPPFYETKNYVKKVMKEYRYLKKYGLPKSRHALTKLK
jgi:soluble lytic murein transglycosylase-like protein